MKRETILWSIILIVGAILVIGNTMMRGAGVAYVKDVPVEVVNVGTAEDPKWINFNSIDMLDYPELPADFEAIPADQRISWMTIERAQPRDFVEAGGEAAAANPYRPDLMQTLGIWLAALFTLFILSFLYKDNPLYKIAEACVIGISAAYWIVVNFWGMFVPNLMGKLAPTWVKANVMPGLEGPNGTEPTQDLVFLVPLILGILLLWRLSPKGGWIARWPMAMIIGVFCGLKLVSFLQADFLLQIRPGIQSLWVLDDAGNLAFWDSVKSVLLFVGVMSCLVYFFFSIEHKGIVGKTAKLGIWFLMITFGAAFGYTVMGRIALLAIRMEFLFDDWLWIIDPTGKRAAVDAVVSVLAGLGVI